MPLARSFEVDDLFARLPNLDRGALLVLAAAHAARDPMRDRAWERARAVVAREHMEADLDDVRNRVARWATSLGAIAGQETGTGMADLLLTDLRRTSAAAVLDAAAALLLGELLGEDDRAALLGPWRAVAGQ